MESTPTGEETLEAGPAAFREDDEMPQGRRRRRRRRIVVIASGLVLGGVLDGARFGVASGLLLGLVVNLTAQAGDLLESRFKRRAQVKDSGTTFGPSGGMLDLVDSLLLSAPLVALLWPLLFELPT